MYLDEYLSSFSNQSTLSIVGPMTRLQMDLIEPVVFVDGGASNNTNGVGFSVGDNDSYKGKLDEVLPTDKDYSDLSYVLDSCIKKFTKINLFGFLGGRRDHELINLMEAHQALNNSTTKFMCNFDNIIFGYSRGSWKKFIKSTFSLICFEPIVFELDGDCKYKIEKGNKLKCLSSHGLSNVGDGEVTFNSSGPFFIYIVN